MRLLWISHLLPFPPHGGVLQRSHHLLRQAASRYEVHLAALSQRALHPTDEALRQATAELSALCARVEAFPIPSDRSRLHWTAMTVAAYFRSSPYDVNWLRSAPLAASLRELARSQRFDVIHVDTIGLAPYARAFGDTPVVLNHHNVESHMMERRCDREASRLRRAYLRRDARKLAALERDLCPRAAVNLVVSDLDAQRLRDAVGPARTAVVDNGVDVDYFRPSRTPGDGDGGLVFAGGMNWYPNREAMLFLIREVWPALAAEDPAARVTVLGQDPPAELRAAAADPRVSVPGFVDDVRPYLDAASIYVCPIRDGGGTRLKILDALAMAKPLVATALAVEGLELAEEVHYLRAESPAEFVRQIRRLQHDAPLRERMARAGRALAEERYSWRVIGGRLEDAYAQARDHARASTRPAHVPARRDRAASPAPQASPAPR